jgi:hypothetical protein
VTVEGEPGNVLQPRLDRRVPGDVAAAVERLAHHHVVDQQGIHPGT